MMTANDAGSGPDDPPLTPKSRGRSDRRVALTPYQRDALRLIIRNLERPKTIPKETWGALRFGEAIEIKKAHLAQIAELTPKLRETLAFWGSAES